MQVAIGVPSGVQWYASLASCLTTFVSVFRRVRDVADRVEPRTGAEVKEQSVTRAQT